MIKHFYSYHVEIDSLVIEIESLSIKDSEKKHLTQLAESQIHHAVLDSILSELSSEDKKTFLSHLNSKNHEKTWKFLNSVLKNAEEIITASANKIKTGLHKDIKELSGRP